jgi:dTDP-glucose 4,6-dehydratase
MNLLVTGAAGFIGSHFVLRHVEKHSQDAIVVLDKCTYASDTSFLDPVASRITFMEGDIADQKLVASIIAKHKIDTIVNFAAESHVDNSIENATPFLHTNVIGVQSLIEVLKTYPHVHLLHISTDEVYGDLRDDEPPKTVLAPLRPSSPYAASKAAGELLLMAAMRTFDLRACVTRCTNNYGPHQADEKFIPTVIRHALNNEPIPVYGNGKNKRDWIFVTDHCDALETVLTTEWTFDPGGHFFNIGIDREFENIAVAKMILKILQKPESLISFVTDRPGHDWRYSVDSSETRILGWEPQVDFEDGLTQTVEWYRHRYSG